MKLILNQTRKRFLIKKCYFFKALMAGFSPATVQQNTYLRYDNFHYLFL